MNLMESLSSQATDSDVSIHTQANNTIETHTDLLQLIKCLNSIFERVLLQSSN